MIVRFEIQQPQIQEIIQKVKSITEYTHRSTVASEKLREIQLQMGLQPQLRLKQDIATRWHSTYFMMRRFTEVKEPLISTLALVNTQLTALSLEEWKIINEVCEVLQPFEEVTVDLSLERFVADSKAILMARGLQRATAHRQKRSSIHKPVREMIKILMAELTKRFGGIEQVNVLAEAASLDLRFKKHAIIHEKHEQDAVTRVVGLVAVASRVARPPPLATPSTEEGKMTHPPILPRIQFLWSGQILGESPA
ncbi:Zinc finger BED domain-containing protein 4 [Chionoecetes opilio]|uniref:Zinc finger BED domain-containing protein 4 n=1 Tax=Chionoecetes opilio TaxID=41210 RepID=A0A8J8WAJ9_CHIOP|nr:Zinc finger BED domain-containing protein 4 [Chionoecetes opilio]